MAQRVVEQRIVGRGAGRRHPLPVHLQPAAQRELRYDCPGESVIEADSRLRQHGAAFVVEGQQQKVGGEHAILDGSTSPKASEATVVCDGLFWRRSCCGKSGHGWPW